MSNSTRWAVHIVRSISAGSHDYPVAIGIQDAGHGASLEPFATAGQEFNWRLETMGVFATFERAVESLAQEVKASFAVWAATRSIDDELILVRPFPSGSPPNRYVRLATSTGQKLRWTVDPTDLHEPYGGSTTDPPLLRGHTGETRGLVTQVLVDQALDEADVRGERVGILLEAGSTSRFHLVWGRDMDDAPSETIIFVTNPPGDRSFFENGSDPA